MTPLAWLLGLVLPACGAVGAAGLPVPPPADAAHIVRPASPNTALAAPAGFQPTPDIVTEVYPVPPRRLFDAVRSVAAAQPRTFLAAEYPGQLQAHYVVRSAVLNFPDLVMIEALLDDKNTNDGKAATSRLVIWSRSVYGESDLGVNRARVATWLAALDLSLAVPMTAKVPVNTISGKN
jgi:uncharacterized protein (DUF1499 family)